jgi:hypothetical protein
MSFAAEQDSNGYQLRVTAISLCNGYFFTLKNEPTNLCTAFFSHAAETLVTDIFVYVVGGVRHPNYCPSTYVILGVLLAFQLYYLGISSHHYITPQYLN